MSKVLATSHIFVISKNMDIVDLGEYSGQLCRPSPLKGTPMLEIDHPSTNSKQIFISTNETIPITDIFSRSNKNDDCIIYGTIHGEPPTIGESAIIKINPYFSWGTAERLAKEVEVHNKFLSRGARYIKSEKKNSNSKGTKTISRPNPIVERIKQVQL